jgi:hypothetical protein
MPPTRQPDGGFVTDLARAARVQLTFLRSAELDQQRRVQG